MDRLVTFLKGSKLYRCSKCPEMSKRRFNVERHMKRFHEPKIKKICCGITFYTKSEFYDHREKIHGERKRYIKKVIFSIEEEENSSSFEKETAIEQETENSCREFSKAQANNEFSPKCEKLSAPKKYFLSQWKENSEMLQLRREPVTNIENNIEDVIGRKTAMKRAAQKQIKVNDSSSNKENVKIYNITDYSREGIDKGLRSITF